MKLKVLGSSSSGNCYIFENNEEALIIEAGVPFLKVKKALNFDLSKIVGCLISHEHGDHADYVNQVLEACVPVYLSAGTNRALSIRGKRYPLLCESECLFTVGGFQILPFNVKHDANEPLGFLINHSDTGTILFATDTYYLPFKFDQLNNILIECNYRLDILEQNIANGLVPALLRRRTVESHMSYNTCLETLQANDLRAVNKIILIHLSGGNSDSEAFIKGVRKATGKTVLVAEQGLEVNINKTPF